MPRNWFLIPAYNEEENLRWLLPNIRRFMHAFHYSYDIVVVDDGSSDGTSDVVREMADVHGIRARVVRHPVNRGPGAGFKTGFDEILKYAADDDLVITIEADNTSDLCVLNRMLMRADRGYDLVLASVYGGGRIIGAPRSRLMLSHVANTLIRQAFRLYGLHTFSSFFRVHRARMLRQVMEVYGDDFVTEEGFVCAVEMLVKMHHMGFSISEVPMLLDSNIRIGDSKMKVWRNVKAYLRVIQNLNTKPGALKGKDFAHRGGT